MNISKWTNIIKMILLKIVDEIERRINDKNGTASDSFASSLYTSIKFMVMEQVDGLVDEAVAYVKKQINDLALLIAEKTATILASLVHVLIIVGVVFVIFMFLAIALALFIGEWLGHSYYGFLITAALCLIILILLVKYGQAYITQKIKGNLTKLI